MALLLQKYILRYLVAKVYNVPLLSDGFRRKKKKMYIHIVTKREKNIHRNDNNEAKGQHVNKQCI